MHSYYNRKTKKIESYQETNDNAVNFLYNNRFGRIILKTVVARPWFSKLIGCYYNSKISQSKIAPFVYKNKVDMYGTTTSDYNSFSDFFIRKNPNIDIDNYENSLIAIADSKLSIYNISPDTTIKIKNSIYSVSDLIKSESLARDFNGGKCLVFRLSMNDNHRYIYCDSGSRAASKYIKGELHTVRPISDKYNTFVRNTRQCHILDMENLGRVIWIEVGAILVGKMHNHPNKLFKKGDEKGYFELGGSTIVLLVKNNIQIDKDIEQSNEQGIETQVHAGERIGTIC